MKDNQDHVNRDYRAWHGAQDLKYFDVCVRQSDLAIGVDLESYTDSLVTLCRNTLIKLRGDLEEYIKLDPAFRKALLPVPISTAAPEVVRRMGRASAAAAVGPMAAVAGAIAELVGEALVPHCRDIIVENGGDIFLQTNHERIIAIFAGASRFSKRIGIRIEGDGRPVGICTSSGTVGHSLSLGRADAMVIRSRSATLSDAAATGAGNMVDTKKDLMKAIAYAQQIEGIEGVLAIKDDQMAAWGNMEIVPIPTRGIPSP